MIFEYRIYEVVPGRMQDLHHRFKNHTLKFFTKHGIKPIAFFTEPSCADDQLSYIVAFEDLDQRKQCWDNFVSDPEWIRVKIESEQEENLVSKITSRIFNATDYSPVLLGSDNG